jgi:hypothetical protein
MYLRLAGGGPNRETPDSRDRVARVVDPKGVGLRRVPAVGEGENVDEVVRFTSTVSLNTPITL